MNVFSTKEIIKRATFEINKGMKNAVSISFAFTVDILVRSENMKKLFEIILHVEWVISLRNWLGSQK